MKITKKIVLIVMVLLVALPVFASDISDDDGNNWQSFNESEKSCYVVGMLAGQAVVYRSTMGIVNGLIESFEKSEGLEGPLLSGIKDTLNETAVIGVTGGQLREGLNTFYGDFANRRVKVVDAASIVKMQVKGEDQELIIAQTRYLRMQPVDEKIIAMGLRLFVLHEAVYGQNVSSEQKRSLRKRFPLEYKMVEEGKIDRDILLKARYFLDKNNKMHLLFLYGIYK